MGYHVPKSLPDALEIVAETGAAIIAGGTDVFPALGDAPAPRDMLDISRLPELQGLTHGADGWRIGAATRWSDILKPNLPPCFDGLKLAAREVGGWQIQNAGTIAGNICNASPAADGVPPLLTLNSRVELASAHGTRQVPLSDFITGPRQTDLRSGEIVSALLIPTLPDTARSHFLKLGARKYLVISIAMVACMIQTDEAGRITVAHVAVGACSATAQRLPGLEAALAGRTRSDLSQDTALWADHLSPLSPLSDIRGSGAYRLEAAAELCRRTVLTALDPTP